MDAKEFLDTYGPEKAESVAIAAGTTLVYFKQLATGFRSPSPELAKKLEAESGGVMTRQALRPDIYDEPQSEAVNQ